MNRWRKVISALLSAALLAVLPATAAAAAPSVTDLLEQSTFLEQQKEVKQEELGEYQEKYNQLLDEIAALEEEMIETGERIAEVREELAAAEAQAETQYEEMKLRIQYIFESGGEKGAMTVFLESQNFASLVTSSEYIKSVHGYDRDKLKEYQELQRQVQALKDELDEKMAVLEEQQEELSEKQDEMNELMETISAEIETLDQEIQQALGEISSIFGVDGSINYYEGEGDTAAAQAIVMAAYSQLGVPYVWGGTSPFSALDCSGLTQYAHRMAGISIPRTSGEQLAAGRIVADPRPGDIAWTPGHVGIYIGEDRMIEAPRTGLDVRISGVRVTVYLRYW